MSPLLPQGDSFCRFRFEGSVTGCGFPQNSGGSLFAALRKAEIWITSAVPFMNVAAAGAKGLPVLIRVRIAGTRKKFF